MNYIRSPAQPAHSAFSDWPTAMVTMDDVHDYKSWGLIDMSHWAVRRGRSAGGRQVGVGHTPSHETYRK